MKPSLRQGLSIIRQVQVRAPKTSATGKQQRPDPKLATEGLSDLPANLKLAPKEKQLAYLMGGLLDTPRIQLQVNPRTKLDALYLRDSCRCPECVDEHSGQKKFNTTDIPYNISFQNVKADDPTTYKLKWTNDIKGASRDHSTVFDKKLLGHLDKYDHRNPGFGSRPWTKRLMEENFVKVDFESYMNSEEGYLRALDQLQQWGLVVIEKAPEDETAIERIGEKIGPLRHTFYGRTWDVKDKPKAENVAYTSGHLGLHMDLLYMKQPPGLQLLHCLRAAGVGGESIFSDSRQAAQMIKEMSPRGFDALSNFPVAYQYTKGGHHFYDSKPVFELSPYSDPSPDAPPYRAIQNINWAPPFQGPFRVDIGLNDNGNALRAWHRAARAFDLAINHETNLFKYRLQEGDCVIFNNRRILHGRTAFSMGGSGEDGQRVRFLKGAYLDHDDFNSQLRVTKKKRSNLFRSEKSPLLTGNQAGGEMVAPEEEEHDDDSVVVDGEAQDMDHVAEEEESSRLKLEEARMQAAQRFFEPQSAVEESTAGSLEEDTSTDPPKEEARG